jgi:hypothetical protein
LPKVLVCPEVRVQKLRCGAQYPTDRSGLPVLIFLYSLPVIFRRNKVTTVFPYPLANLPKDRCGIKIAGLHRIIVSMLNTVHFAGIAP